MQTTNIQLNSNIEPVETNRLTLNLKYSGLAELISILTQFVLDEPERFSQDELNVIADSCQNAFFSLADIQTIASRAMLLAEQGNFDDFQEFYSSKAYDFNSFLVTNSETLNELYELERIAKNIQEQKAVKAFNKQANQSN